MSETKENKEKPYTLRKVRSELKKLENSREQKKKKIKTLTEELKAENARIKELESLYDELYHEELQKQIYTAWFKKGTMTGEQVAKILELSKQIQDKIDILDVDTMVQAVTTVYEQQKPENSPDTDEPEPKEQIEEKPVISSVQYPEIRNKVTT